MAKIFATRELPGDALASLAETHDVHVFPEERAPSPEELRENLRDVDVLISMLCDQVDRQAIQRANRLKIIANYAVGTNNIDVDWATIKDIAVLHTPDVLTDCTADMAFALLLATARRLQEGGQLIRAQEWGEWQPDFMLGTRVSGKQLGIIGMGRIGLAVARRARAFSMRIVYHNRKPLAFGRSRELGATYVSLEELLQTSDFVSLHCPLTPQTHHLIDKNALEMMQPHAILINTSRGPVIDEAALVQALSENRLRAAGLDVFEEEPTVHPTLLTLKQVVLSPHLGSATRETRSEMATLLARGIEDTLRSRLPINILNPEVLPSLRKNLHSSS